MIWRSTPLAPGPRSTPSAGTAASMRSISRAPIRRTTASTRAASTITTRRQCSRGAPSTASIGRRRLLPAVANGKRSGSAFALDHQLAGDAAHIDLVVKSLHRRAREMPGEAARGRAAPHVLVGKMRVDIEHRIELRRRDVLPAEAERAHAPLHRAEHVARLVAHTVRRLVTEPDDALGIAAGAVGRLATTGRDKALPGARHGIAERVE